MSCCTFTGALPCGLGEIVLGSLALSPSLSSQTLEEALVAYLLGCPRLTCLIGSRLYPHQVARSNSTWPVVTYFRTGSEHEHNLAGGAGFGWATFNFDIWSPTYLDVCKVGPRLRLAMQGFRGVWGNVAVGAVLVDDETDAVEEPQDSSSTCWYSRSLDFRVLYGEKVPQF